MLCINHVNNSDISVFMSVSTCRLTAAMIAQNRLSPGYKPRIIDFGIRLVYIDALHPRALHAFVRRAYYTRHIPWGGIITNKCIDLQSAQSFLYSGHESRQVNFSHSSDAERMIFHNALLDKAGSTQVSGHVVNSKCTKIGFINFNLTGKESLLDQILLSLHLSHLSHLSCPVLQKWVANR